MNKRKKIVTIISAVILILTGAVIGTAYISGADGFLPWGGNDEPTNIGALSSPDIMSNYIRVGGLTTYSFMTPAHSATTTASQVVCQFQSPATSSLSFASFSGIASSSAITVTFGKAKSTTPALNTQASSTQNWYLASSSGVIGYELTIGANDYSKSYVASSSAVTTAMGTNSLATSTLFATNEWLTISVRGGTTGQFYKTPEYADPLTNARPYCTAEFKVIGY